ncbi:excisionase family DNA binding protein [Kitasatospora sp. GP30]|uniref:helix-turn-helix domain-containing protein n=1 Tax=Kitasatospora sp. GP30 TaxID=3035084 RepID=UPI000CBCE285|nr:helix-turn-helix domain-containing protein [Kitasatospora sp. GP30]MDH6141021.1 excisionase family DNA binding protein [Kitasatospora sp. GP30]
MARQIPAGVWLSGEDACVLDGLVRRAVYDAGRRDGHVPARVVELSEVIHRAAIEFRTTVLASADSGTGEDSSGSAIALSQPSDLERLTARQAARLAGVSEEFIRRLACEGVLQGTKSGHRGAWLLDPSSVATWMAGRGRAAA